MKHLTWDEVWAYVDGECDDAASLLEHFQSCDTCKDMLAQAERTNEALKMAFAYAVPKTSETQFTDLLAKIKGSMPQDNNRRFRRSRKWVWMSGAAASAAVLALAVLNWPAWHHFANDHSSAGVASSIAMVNKSSAGSTSSTSADQSSGMQSSSSDSGSSAATPATAASSASSTGSTLNAMQIQPSKQGITQSAQNGAGPASVDQTPPQQTVPPDHNQQAIAPNQTVPADSTTTTSSSSMSMAAGMITPMLQGDVTVELADGAGHVIPDAHVSLVVNGQVQATQSTGNDGRAVFDNVSVLQDPLLQGTFGPKMPAQGVLTVVAWKDGYQPQVYYGVDVFANGTTTDELQLTMQPVTGDASTGSQVGVSGASSSNSYAAQVWDGFAAGAEPLIENAVATGQIKDIPQGDTTLDFTVQDESGRPVSGADVAVIAGGHITGYGETSALGTVSLCASGVADWRTMDGVQTASIVVLKAGFNPAVGFNQPLLGGTNRVVLVHMRPVGTRTGVRDDSTSTVTRLAGERMILPADAQQIYALAVAATQR